MERTFFKQLSKSGVESGVDNGIESGVESGVDNGGVNVGKKASPATQKKITERYNSILKLINSNPFITANQLSETLSIPPRTIQRYLAKMQTSGMLIREGSDNGGRWIILKSMEKSLKG